jgi:hypothetical protein
MPLQRLHWHASIKATALLLHDDYKGWVSQRNAKPAISKPHTRITHRIPGRRG